MAMKENLIGKKIVDVVPWNPQKYDDENVLQILFEDGTSVFFIGDYGGYTGESIDEYIAFINVLSEKEFKDWNDNGYAPIKSEP